MERTEVVTDNDNLLFRTDLGIIGPVCSIVTAISFSPQGSNLVQAGANGGGIFISHDNGVVWTKIGAPRSRPRSPVFTGRTRTP